MNRNASIEQVIESLDKNIIRKYQTSPLIGIGMIFIGIGLMYADFEIAWLSKSFLSAIIIMGAMLLVVYGIIHSLLPKIYYKSPVNDQKLNFHDVYFDDREFDKLTNIIEHGQLHEIASLKKSSHNGIKLRIANTDDKKICFAQIVRYFPEQYAHKTPVKQLTQTEVDALFEALHLSECKINISSKIVSI